ncbi:diacylglycerol/lipid kinase family protein [Rhabdothermincola sp.]|uniref:diacylglycerol/lipid kinase family protein n=1 Tax=Rhabdothermincola sp. TaxID=2820405 RepID=UPI002FE1FF0A
MTGSHHPVRFLRRRVDASPARRVAAAVALALDVAALVSLVVLVLSRPLHTLLLVVWAAALLLSLLVAVTSTGWRHRLGMLGAAVFGVALVLSILLWRPGSREVSWQAPVTIVLAGAGAVLTRSVLRVRPPSGGVALAARGIRARGTPVLIVNPRSGGGRAEEAGLCRLAASMGIEVVLLEEGADLVDLAEAAVRAGADVLGMAGGDGSLGEVASVAIRHGLPFVCVPAGTRNHFALDLGLDRDDPRQALAAFVDGEERHIDHGVVNDRVFLNNVSLGVYAAIVEQDSYRDAKIETALAMLPELWAEGGPWFDLRFDVPGHGRLDRAALVQISNNPYGRQVGRREQLDTGELGVLTVDPQRLGDLVGLTVLAAAGQPERSPALWSWTAASLRIDSSQHRISAGVDGEMVVFDSPLDLRSVHRGLRVLVPRGTRVGLAEQTLGDGTAYRALFELAFGLGGPDR